MKQLRVRKGHHFSESHGRFYDEMHEAASNDNRNTRFKERIDGLMQNARMLPVGSEGRKALNREIRRNLRRHRHELNRREIKRLQAECMIAGEFSERCRQEYYRLTGRTAAESEARSALTGLERWLGSWPLRPDRGYIGMLESARFRLSALLERTDAELARHVPKREETEETPFRLGGRTLLLEKRK